MEYRIELRDKSFNVLEYLENEAYNINWEYLRIGGCGSFSFNLPRKYDEPGYVSGDFNVRIYRRNPTTNNYDLRYSGFVEDRSPTLKVKEEMSVNGYGYVSQLKRIIVNASYTSQEVSAIVKDILDNYIVPNTDITYDVADIENTGFTPSQLDFNTSAQSIIQTLADLVGTREWGVGQDRKFFFKARSETVNFRPVIGDDIRMLSSIDSFREIVNRLKIEGGDVAGVKFTRTVNADDGGSSQTKYGLRERLYINSAITTNDVADQIGKAILAEKSDVAMRASLEQVGDESQTEAIIPLGLIEPQVPGIRYGEKKYGTFLYSGRINYQINRISYRINRDKSLTKRLEIGQLRPNITENIQQLLYEIDQLRSARE